MKHTHLLFDDSIKSASSGVCICARFGDRHESICALLVPRGFLANSRLVRSKGYLVCLHRVWLCDIPKYLVRLHHGLLYKDITTKGWEVPFRRYEAVRLPLERWHSSHHVVDCLLNVSSLIRVLCNRCVTFNRCTRRTRGKEGERTARTRWRR